MMSIDRIKYKKGLNHLYNLDDVVTHLECEVKWPLGSSIALLPTKLVEVMEFQLSYLKS